jgi:hypothetical protein
MQSSASAEDVDHLLIGCSARLISALLLAAVATGAVTAAGTDTGSSGSDADLASELS